MRHRVSYIHSAKHEDVLRSANVSAVEIKPGIPVAREDKYTLDVGPYTYISAIRIHISRPSTTKNGGDFLEMSQNIAPFGYNYQAGLHVYAVPVGVAGPGEEAQFYAQLNSVLMLVLGIEVPSEKWVLSLNSFYYHTNNVPGVRMLQISDFLSDWADLDCFYENAKLVITTLDPDLQNRIIDVRGRKYYTEVGVFLLLSKSSRDDLILSGARVVMNDGEILDKPEVHKTMFHVKPRHRLLVPKSGFSLRENGLHPVFTMGDFPPIPVDDDVLGCQLFSYLTLDKSVFVDPYQLPDLLRIVAHYGARDLELPEYAVAQWGSEILMEVADSVHAPVELTLHTRYQAPNVTRSHTDVFVDKPVVFYACDAIGDSFLLKNSPFDTRKPIGGSFEKFFTEDTVFYHVLERGSAHLQIPNGSGDPVIVNLATVAALFIGTLMVVLAAYKKWTGPIVAPAKKHE